MIELSDKLLEKIRIYTKEEELEIKWRIYLEQLKTFDDKLKDIKEEYEDYLKFEIPKDLHRIEQRSFNLKFNLFITNISL